MIVIEKATSKSVDVVDIRYDGTGYPVFLYYQDGQWLQKSAKYFCPPGGNDVKAIDEAIKWLDKLRTCIQPREAPSMHVFFRHTSLLLLEIHKVFLRRSALSDEKIRCISGAPQD